MTAEAPKSLRVPGLWQAVFITESNSPTHRMQGNSKKARPWAVLLSESNFQVYFCFPLLLHLGLARTVLSAAEKEPGMVNEVAANSCFLSEHSITVGKVIANPAAPRVFFPWKLLNSFRRAKQLFFLLPVINILGTVPCPRAEKSGLWDPHRGPIAPSRGTSCPCERPVHELMGE